MLPIEAQKLVRKTTSEVCEDLLGHLKHEATPAAEVEPEQNPSSETSLPQSLPDMQQLIDLTTCDHADPIRPLLFA